MSAVSMFPWKRKIVHVVSSRLTFFIRKVRRRNCFVLFWVDNLGEADRYTLASIERHRSFCRVLSKPNRSNRATKRTRNASHSYVFTWLIVRFTERPAKNPTKQAPATAARLRSRPHLRGDTFDGGHYGRDHGHPRREQHGGRDTRANHAHEGHQDHVKHESRLQCLRVRRFFC